MQTINHNIIPEGVRSSLLHYGLHIVLDKILRIEHVKEVELGVGRDRGL